MYNIHVLDTLLLFLKVNFTGCRLKDLYSKCSLISKGRELVVKRHKAFQSKTMLDFSEDHKFKLNAEHVNDFSLKIQIKRSAPPLQKSEFSIGITQLRFERHSSVHILFLNLWGEQKQRRQCIAKTKSFCQPSIKKPLATLPCKIAHPTLISVCTHESL